MNIATAAAEPRIHHQWMPDELRMETGFSPDTIKLLIDMGHPLDISTRTSGRTNSIMLQDGWLLGASDTRSPVDLSQAIHHRASNLEPAHDAQQ